MEPKKSTSADQDRPIIITGYVVMGAVIVMGMVLRMMEFRSIVPPSNSLSSNLVELADEEIVEMNQNTPTSLPPPPTPPPPPAPHEEVKTYKNT